LCEAGTDWPRLSAKCSMTEIPSRRLGMNIPVAVIARVDAALK
jgi:hypothetical protein